MMFWKKGKHKQGKHEQKLQYNGSSSSFSSEQEIPRESSLYIRMDGCELEKCTWYHFKYESVEQNLRICGDEMKNNITHILDNVDTETAWGNNFVISDSRIYKFNVTEDVCFFDVDHIESDPNLVWNDAPSLNCDPDISRVAILDGSIYVLGGTCDAIYSDYAEVLKPQSSQWELLDSFPPKFEFYISVFFHGVPELHKLLIGSFEENLLYLYDPETTELEKIEDFADEFMPTEDSVVAGNCLVWTVTNIFYAFDLVEKKLYCEFTNDISFPITEETTSYKLRYLGNNKFCLIVLEPFTCLEDESYLHFFELSIKEYSLHCFGQRLFCPCVLSSYKFAITWSDNITGALFVASLMCKEASFCGHSGTCNVI